MKRYFFFLFLCLQIFVAHAQSGKYAGTYKKLIGKTFTDQRNMPGMEKLTFFQGSMLSDVNDPYQLLIDVYKKGAYAVIVLYQVTDTTTRTFTFRDLIEIKAVPAGYDFKTTGTCEVTGSKESEPIIAIAKPGSQEYTRMIRQAWRCNRFTLAFEAMSIKNMKCLNEGLE